MSNPGCGLIRSRRGFTGSAMNGPNASPLRWHFIARKV
jgi:hypothetical protein